MNVCSAADKECDEVQSITVNAGNCIFVKHLPYKWRRIFFNHKQRPACLLFITAARKCIQSTIMNR